MAARHALAVALILLPALLLSGCKANTTAPGSDNARPGSGPIAASAPVADAGKIIGTVRFNGKPPARAKIDMSMDPACAVSADENDAEQFVVANSKLANVYVYIKSGAPQATAAAGTSPVTLDQKGCRYLPHVIALQQGGSVKFLNSDMTMHNIHTTPATDGNPVVDVSQGPNGSPQLKQFEHAETMLSVRCNNHPWMNAFINVAPNQFFAVSSADGSFTIPGLPPGNYVLAAVHEKLGEQDIPMVISPNSVAKADFVYASK